MTSQIRSVRIMCLSGLIALSACEFDIHDNTVTIPNATLNFNTDADLNNVDSSQAIPLTLTAERVYLVEPDVTPPPEHVADAAHFQIYLDDVNTPPVMVTAQTNVNVLILPATPKGPHKLICRLHKHDGTPTSTRVEVNINVTVNVNTGGTDAGSSDAGI